MSLERIVSGESGYAGESQDPAAGGGGARREDGAGEAAEVGNHTEEWWCHTPRRRKAIMFMARALDNLLDAPAGFGFRVPLDSWTPVQSDAATPLN